MGKDFVIFLDRALLICTTFNYIYFEWVGDVTVVVYSCCRYGKRKCNMFICGAYIFILYLASVDMDQCSLQDIYLAGCWNALGYVSKSTKVCNFDTYGMNYVYFDFLVSYVDILLIVKDA